MPATALSRPDSNEDAVHPSVHAISDAPLNWQVFETMEAAEPLWRQLEAIAVLTPYQRFDWISGWLKACGGTHRLAIVVILQESNPVALLPLAIARRAGLREATIIGTHMGNADFMMLHGAAAPLLTREVLAAALAEAKRVAGIDYVALFNQPESWAGIENPLLQFPRQPGPNNLYLGSLNDKGSFEQFDAKRLNNLLRRKRKLGEAMGGEVVLRAATTVEEIDLFHTVFLEQRAARFAQMGIDNIFAQPHFVRFFRQAAIASLTMPRPVMILHALYARDEIVATACGTIAGHHYSQYINATASGEPAKHRVVGLLMHELFADVAARGGNSIDMGLGDFDYKADWTVPTAVYDGIIPLTPAGRIAGAAILAIRRAKRAIKQDDRLWSLVRKLRARLRSRRTVPPAAPPRA